MPDLPGGYYHDYICPRHGVELDFLPDAPCEHRCPVDHERFEGERYDSAWRWFVNHEISEAALRVAVLYILDSTPAHLNTVRGILFEYAERYTGYSRASRPGPNPGIATYTTLDESVWIVPLAWAFSLLSGNLTAAERDSIVSKLFMPAAEHLVCRHYRQIHNFSCWHNAAIVTLGHVACRHDLVELAVDGEVGQRAQLRAGMLPDGLWYEGSMSYHFYALWAILLSAIAARHYSAQNIFQESLIYRALRTPLDCAFPDGGLPATNDCWFFSSVVDKCCHGVPPSAGFYEIGFAAYGDPAFSGVLRRIYRTADRDSLYALLFGVEEIPNAPLLERRSIHLPTSGLAILRAGEDLDLVLKYGPHGGQHGHPDKLSLIGCAGDWRFSPDLGTPGYGTESLESWYRQTLSHNTVLIDGESQPPAEGSLCQFQATGTPQLAEAAVRWETGNYQGVRMRRAVLACAEYFVDIFAVQCVGSRRIEWIYHNAGAISRQVLSDPASLAGGAAYQHLSDIRTASASGPLQILWRDGSASMAMWLHPSNSERLFTGSSPANPPATLFGFLMRQIEAAEAVFLSIFHPYRSSAAIQNVVWATPLRFEVLLRNRRDRWSFNVSDGALNYDFASMPGPV